MVLRRRTLVVPVACLALLCAGIGAGVGVGPTTAQDSAVVVGRPDLSVFAPDAVLVPGTRTTVDVLVSNEGEVTRGGPTAFEERVSTARAVSLRVRSGDAPVDVRTGATPVGTVPRGETGRTTVSLVVPEDAPPGSYRLPVDVTYTYTRAVEYEPGNEVDVSYSETTVTRRATLTVRVENRPRFRVVDATTDLAPGESGTVSVALENVGTRSASEASVLVGSSDLDLRLGGPEEPVPETDPRNGTTGAAAGGTWAPGERRRIDLSARLARGAAVRDYPLSVLVTYTDDDGIVQRSREYTAAVRPTAPVRLAVRNVTADLRVGADGDLRGRVVNDGTTTVRDAVLVLRASGDATVGDDREYAVGDLPPGASAPFAFPVDVPETADPGPRQFAFVVRYAGPDDRTVVTDPLRADVAVGGRRDAFRVEATDARFRIDSDGRLGVRVTNARDRRVTDVEMTLNATDPLSSDAPTAFVPELASGGTTTVGFALSVSSDAVASTYPARLTIRYETPDGEVRTAGPFPVGVRVVEGEATEPLLVGAAVLVALAVAALWWRARR